MEMALLNMPCDRCVPNKMGALKAPMKSINVYFFETLLGFFLI